MIERHYVVSYRRDVKIVLLGLVIGLLSILWELVVHVEAVKECVRGLRPLLHSLAPSIQAGNDPSSEVGQLQPHRAREYISFRLYILHYRERLTVSGLLGSPLVV
jgi:hypothetical protein